MKSKEILPEEERQRLIDRIINYGNGQITFETEVVTLILNALVAAEEEHEDLMRMVGVMGTIAEEKDKEIIKLESRIVEQERLTRKIIEDQQGEIEHLQKKADTNYYSRIEAERKRRILEKDIEQFKKDI